MVVLLHFTAVEVEMDGYYVLNERGEPVLERDFGAWTRWFERADRRLARSVISTDVTVLTIFVGVDQNPRGGVLRLFETRVFGGILDGEQARYATSAEALDGHAKLAEWCRIGASTGYGVSAADLEP
jgi:hypothetical protein